MLMDEYMMLGAGNSHGDYTLTGITVTENGTPGKGARFEIAVPMGAYWFVR